jgi:hypothetical protein
MRAEEPKIKKMGWHYDFVAAFSGSDFSILERG